MSLAALALFLSTNKEAKEEKLDEFTEICAGADPKWEDNISRDTAYWPDFVRWVKQALASEGDVRYRMKSVLMGNESIKKLFTNKDPKQNDEQVIEMYFIAENNTDLDLIKMYIPISTEFSINFGRSVDDLATKLMNMETYYPLYADCIIAYSQTVSASARTTAVSDFLLFVREIEDQLSSE